MLQFSIIQNPKSNSEKLILYLAYQHILGKSCYKIKKISWRCENDRGGKFHDIPANYYLFLPGLGNFVRASFPGILLTAKYTNKV